MNTTHITTTTLIKNLTYIPAIFLGLSMESYAILAILMMVDTLFGIIRVIVVNGGQHFKSYKLTAGMLSKVTVLMVPLLLAWAGKGAGIELIFLAKAVLGILVLAEFYSILGSVYSIRIKKDVPEYDAVSAVLKVLQKTIEKMIKTNVPK